MQLDVFGMKIKIYYEPILENMGLCGYFDAEKSKIVIDSTMSKAEQDKTLLHEVFHALAFRLGWKQAIPIQLEETMAEQFSSLLCENFSLRIKK